MYPPPSLIPLTYPFSSSSFSKLNHSLSSPVHLLLLLLYLRSILFPLILYKLPMSSYSFSFLGKLSMKSTGSARNSTVLRGIVPNTRVK